MNMENLELDTFAFELYSKILDAIDFEITKKELTVNSSRASEIIAKAGFSTLLKLQEIATSKKLSSQDILRIASCKTKAELDAATEEINKRNVASGEISKIVNAELAKRNKPITSTAKKRV